MSVVVVVDSSCDLPQSFLEEQNVEVLPIDLVVNDKTYSDTKDPQSMIDFFSQGEFNHLHLADTVRLSPQQVSDVFFERIVNQYDFAIVVTSSRVESESYKIALAASHDIQRQYRPHRESAGLTNGFGMRVINSATVCTGHGLVAAQCLKLFEDGIGKNQLRPTMEEFKTQVYCYMVPKDLYYLRNRAKKRGTKNVGLLSAMVGSALDMVPVTLGHRDKTIPTANIKGFDNAVSKLFTLAIRQMEMGLKTPIITVSIAGDTVDLFEFNGYNQLIEKSKEYGVKVITSVMSLIGGANLGPGAISLAMACDAHDFES